MEEKKEFKYTIGDKVYYQRKLVMGQVNQLLEITKDLKIPENPTVVELITALGDRITEAIAIVLIPADIKHLKEKNIEEVINNIEFDMEPEMVLEVVENFFDCNQISLLLKKLMEMVEKVGEKINPERLEKKEQNNSVLSSAEETL